MTCVSVCVMCRKCTLKYIICSVEIKQGKGEGRLGLCLGARNGDSLQRMVEELLCKPYVASA